MIMITASMVKELREQLLLIKESFEEDSEILKITRYILSDTQTPKCK